MSGADYDTYFDIAAIDGKGKDPIASAYLLADATKEGAAPKEGEQDDRMTFFAAATDV